MLPVHINHPAEKWSCHYATTPPPNHSATRGLIPACHTQYMILARRGTRPVEGPQQREPL